MAYKAYVTTLKNVRKAENADRLMIGECLGEQVIVTSNMYEGQQVFYIPADGQVQEWFGDKYGLFRRDKDGNKADGYLERNGHVKAMKLRGNRSEGIAIPVERVEEAPSDLEPNGAFTKLDGKLAVQKYIPRQKASHGNGQTKTSKKGKYTPKKVYPEFDMHIDTAQLMYNQDAFKPGDDIEVTYKLHGTSGRSALVDAEYKRSWIRKLFHLPAKRKAEYVCGTRRCIVENSGGGFYGNDQFRINHHNRLLPHLEYGMEIYYEIVGWVDKNTTIMPIGSNKKIKDPAFVEEFGDQTIFSYGCKQGESEIYIYRITKDGKEYSPEEIAAWCALHGFKKVPDADRFTFTTWEDLMDRVNNKYFADIHDRIDPSHVLEGVVFRIVNRNKFTAFKTKTFAFKVLENLIKDTSDVPDIEEAQEEEVN